MSQQEKKINKALGASCCIDVHKFVSCLLESDTIKENDTIASLLEMLQQADTKHTDTQTNDDDKISSVQEFIIHLLDIDALKELYTIAEMYDLYEEFMKSENRTPESKQFMCKRLRKINGLTFKQNRIDGVKARRVYVDIPAVRTALKQQ